MPVFERGRSVHGSADDAIRKAQESMTIATKRRRNHKKYFNWFVFFVTFCGYVWAQKPVPEFLPPASNITFATRLDRTAVWAGDQFHYLIIVDYPPDYEFVLDNLTKETVNMDPFQVIDVSKNLVVQKDSSRKLFVDLTLASFSTGQSSIQIPQFTLFYLRKGTKTAGLDQADAESLPVPGPVIGMRRTLSPQ